MGGEMKLKLGLLVLIAAFVLSACYGNGDVNKEATPGATLGTGPVENESAQTPVIEGVPAPTEGAGPVSPTGEAELITAPVLAGTLLGYSVAGPDGAVGDVTGIVTDLLTGQVRYISLVTVGSQPERSILLPWGTFQVVLFPVGENPSGAQPVPQVWLPAAGDVAGAPQFDAGALDNPGDLTANWDAEASAYWAERVPGLPATGEENRNEGLAYLRDERFNQIEFSLVSTEGEELGEIEDIVIGEGGAITFGILDPRGELAEGRDLVVVGWKAMSWIPEEGRFVLNVPAERLNEAPNFSPSELPDTTLPGWDADWMEYWQDTAAQTNDAVTTPTEEGTRLPVNAGALLDQPVVDREGNELGKLVDWWIDLQGRSEYAILQEAGRLVLLPWMALDWNVDEQQMVLNIDPNLLLDAPSFPNTTEMDEDTGWHDSAELYWKDFMPVAEDPAASTAPLAPGAVREEVRLMRLINGPVFGPVGENLGDVTDMIFSPEGQAAYVAIRFGDTVRLVPWMNFEYNPQDGRLVYLDDVVRLSEAPATDIEALDLSAADWDAELRTYWGMK